MNPDRLIEELESMRRAEKEQTLAYRSLAVRAESAGMADLAQRFHDMHADEQHHLSRLTARILELGGRPADLAGVKAAEIPLAGWEPVIRQREHDEIDRYTALASGPMDEDTRALIAEIISVDTQHAAELGGKWTMA